MALGKITRIYSSSCLECTGSNDMRVMGYFLFGDRGYLISIDDSLVSSISTHSWSYQDMISPKLIIDNEMSKIDIFRSSDPDAVIMDIGV